MQWEYQGVHTAGRATTHLHICLHLVANQFFLVFRNQDQQETDLTNGSTLYCGVLVEGVDHKSRGTTMAVIAYFALGEWREETSNVETELNGELCEIPPIPETVRHWERLLSSRD